MSVSRGFASFLHQRSLRLPSTIRDAIYSARPRTQQLQVNARVSSQYYARRFQHSYNAPRRSIVSSDPVLRTVSQTQKPVILYKAPDRVWYTVATYGLGCSTIGLGLFCWKFRSELPEGLAFFVGPTYDVLGVIAFAIGMYIFTAPLNKISLLEVIPSMRGGPLQLRIRARSAPMFRDRIIYAGIGEATISEKTLPLAKELAEAERARKQRISEGLEDLFIVVRVWELSARWIEQKWSTFFNRFKFAVLRFGIAHIKVGSQKWKLDCSGYLLEDGKAIDRLIVVDDDDD
ncbi:hypothetical protein BDV95DRAFT_610324 [Massariosphaeria phaeospora]|uniref:Uncharacterized protein n=1 Tax=Massariosphaeria phaeospora TaxID=100035 RepID=A0A7C8I2W6_9PLEO|nr:hypothetical protein BDV95DRAFT_610324 [Massariosphaeria phaeospora]